VSTNGSTHDDDAVERATRPTLGELAWIGIVVAIGIVQVVRLQWFDALVFAAAALAIIADSTGRLPSSSRVRRVTGRALLIGGVMAAAAVTLLPRHTPAMMVAMLAIGAAVLIVVWPGTTRTAPWPHGLRLLSWWCAAIVIAGCLWELAQFVRGRVAPDIPAPALSDLLNPLLGTPIGHLVFAVVWVTAGAFLVRRAVRR